MDLRKIGIRALLHNFRVGGKIKTHPGAFVVREISDCSKIAGTSRICDVGKDYKIPKVTARVTYADRTAELTDCFNQGYADPEKFLSPEIIKELVLFKSDLNCSQRKSSIRFLYGAATDKELRRIRGACVGYLKDVFGTVHIGLDGTGYSLEYRKADMSRFIDAGLSKTQLEDLVKFQSSGFNRLSLTLSLEESVPVKPLMKILESWDPELTVRINPGDEENFILVTWKRNFSLLGLYDTEKWKFVLTKTNLDLPNILLEAEKKLKLPRNSISFAGIKDKRAITSQFLTCPAVVTEEEIRKAFSEISKTSIQLSDFEKTSRPLKPGFLWGNEFEISVHRDVAKPMQSDFKLQAITENMGKRGFVNYYGPQRFGYPLPDGSSKHVKIGSYMLNRDWESAVMLMLKSDDFMSKFVHSDLLKEYDTSLNVGDFDKACQFALKFPGNVKEQRLRLLKLLLTSNASFKVSLNGLSKTLLHLYPASVLSYVWNCKASQIAENLSSDGAFQDITLPLFGYQKDPKMFEHQSELYRDVLEKEQLQFLLNVNLDLTKEFGFNCRMTPVDRKVFVKPSDFRIDRSSASTNDLLFNFRLPSGSYATVLMNEIL
jgi:TruD family tRNA pseudouridine synthase